MSEPVTKERERKHVVTLKMWAELSYFEFYIGPSCFVPWAELSYTRNNPWLCSSNGSLPLPPGVSKLQKWQNDLSKDSLRTLPGKFLSTRKSLEKNQTQLSNFPVIPPLHDNHNPQSQELH